METVIIEFQKVTKYPLIDFLMRYRNFMLNSYPAINSYFSGETESIDNSHLNFLKKITSDCKDVTAQFKNFANKFSTCGYWELMDYIDDLNTTIEKINKLPKFKRTSLNKRGYQPYIQVSSSVGGFRTMEDIANSVKEKNSDNTDWIELMLSNDLNESDWEIDGLTPINVLIDNRVDIIVSTILDMPIGERIYGKDIARKITFKDNDLLIVEYQENVEQKCDILIELNRGDVPENVLFGKNYQLISGVSSKQFAYPELVNDIQNNFLQNDLFEYANVIDFSYENGNMNITVEIKTKYDYKTEKKIVI
jgi:hypothetical protein